MNRQHWCALLRSVQLVIVLLFTCVAYAQKAPPLISGTVKNEKGEPLSGVTILVKGTQSRALSDDKGAFQIAADTTATLTFTHVGYSPKDTSITGLVMEVVMRQAQAELTEGSLPLLGSAGRSLR